MSAVPVMCWLSYAAGVAEGRRLAALEASVRLRQLGLDLVAGAHRDGAAQGGEMVLGNASGAGSVAGLVKSVAPPGPLA